MSVRKQLADAASTVDGITGHEYYVNVTNPGTVWIRLERIDHPNPFGGLVTWNVVLVLPQDQAQAEKFTEEKMPAVREAVSEHMAIRSVVPQRLDITGVGVLPVVFINGQREEE